MKYSSSQGTRYNTNTIPGSAATRLGIHKIHTCHESWRWIPNTIQYEKKSIKYPGLSCEVACLSWWARQTRTYLPS